MKNWKTTLVGFLAAAANVAASLYMNGVLDPKTLIVSAALAGLGWVAKDAGVTGIEQ